jgi:hypothetical protein
MKFSVRKMVHASLIQNLFNQFLIVLKVAALYF